MNTAADIFKQYMKVNLKLSSDIKLLEYSSCRIFNDYFFFLCSKIKVSKYEEFKNYWDEFYNSSVWVVGTKEGN